MPISRTANWSSTCDPSNSRPTKPRSAT
jgi:hypothetical protein